MRTRIRYIKPVSSLRARLLFCVPLFYCHASSTYLSSAQLMSALACTATLENSAARLNKSYKSSDSRRSVLLMHTPTVFSATFSFL